MTSTPPGSLGSDAALRDGGDVVSAGLIDGGDRIGTGLGHRRGVVEAGLCDVAFVADTILQQIDLVTETGLRNDRGFRLAGLFAIDQVQIADADSRLIDRAAIVVTRLRELNLDELTARQALELLYQLQQKV